MIREAAAREDLAAFCRVWATVTPREPLTPEQLLRRKERQPDRLYLLAEEDGRAIGLALVTPTDSPNRRFVGVRVLPDRRRQGIGSALYEPALAHARALEPEWISTDVSAAEPDSIAWAEHRGFVESAREVELVLSLRGNEQAPPPLHGIEIVEVTPDLHKAAYDLTREAWEDLPVSAPLEVAAFDVWLKRTCPARSPSPRWRTGRWSGSPG